MIPSTTTTVAPEAECKFTSKVYNAEIMENRIGRQTLVKVHSNCEDDQHKYVITQGSGLFFAHFFDAVPHWGFFYRLYLETFTVDC